MLARLQLRQTAAVDENAQCGRAVRTLSEVDGCKVVQEQLLGEVSAENNCCCRAEFWHKGNRRYYHRAVLENRKIYKTYES